MGRSPVSIRLEDWADDVEVAVRRFQEEWRHGRADLETVWAQRSGEATIETLTALAKADLAQRFERGERPEAAEYLDRFPELKDDPERVLSLVYEEYCLREERGERPDTEAFCERYRDWRDSLESQLKYHRVISRVVGPTPEVPKYPVPGERFEHFTISDEIGRGGAARVYLGRDETLEGREVVLKVSADKGREAAILGKLEHPHIVPVLSVAKQADRGMRALCMPLKLGLPLDEVIRRIDPSSAPGSAQVLWDALTHPTSPPGTRDDASAGGLGWTGFDPSDSYANGVAWIVETLAGALEYAHKAEIFHRDVKPANVLLTLKDGPQLLDFNLSHEPNSPEQAEAALRGGTLPYMAPEQLKAFVDPTQWSKVREPADIYSLGLLARELLTGQAPDTPDPGLPLPRAIQALLEKRAIPRAPLSENDTPRVPRVLGEIVDRCLAYTPEDRYENASLLVEDLRRFRAGKTTAGAPVTQKLGNWAIRHWLGIGLVAAGLLCVSAMAMLASQLRLTPEERPEFLAAVAQLEKNSVDSKAFADAALELDRITLEMPQTPVVGFYRAVALCKEARAGEALAIYRQTCREARAQATLEQWVTVHKRMANLAEYLGAEFFRQIDPKDSVQRPRSLEASQTIFKQALSHDPSLFLAKMGLATIAEERGLLAEASAMVTESIDGLRKLPAHDPLKSERLAHLLHQRARILTNWAERDSRDLNPESTLDHLLPRFDQSMRDIREAQSLLGRGNKEALAELQLLRCESMLIKAELLAAHNRANEASQVSQQVKELAGSLRPETPRQKDTLESVLQKLGKVSEKSHVLIAGKSAR